MLYVAVHSKTEEELEGFARGAYNILKPNGYVVGTLLTPWRLRADFPKIERFGRLVRAIKETPEELVDGDEMEFTLGVGSHPVVVRGQYYWSDETIRRVFTRVGFRFEWKQFKVEDGFEAEYEDYVKYSQGVPFIAYKDVQLSNE